MLRSNQKFADESSEWTHHSEQTYRTYPQIEIHPQARLMSWLAVGRFG
jgi:hypothetical protein